MPESITTNNEDLTPEPSGIDLLSDTVALVADGEPASKHLTRALHRSLQSKQAKMDLVQVALTHNSMHRVVKLQKMINAIEMELAGEDGETIAQDLDNDQLLALLRIAHKDMRDHQTFLDEKGTNPLNSSNESLLAEADQIATIDEELVKGLSPASRKKLGGIINLIRNRTIEAEVAEVIEPTKPSQSD